MDEETEVYLMILLFGLLVGLLSFILLKIAYYFFY